MTARLDELGRAMTPATVDGIRIEVAKLYTVLAARTGGEDDIRGVQAIFCEDLGDLPLFAIAAAAQAFRRGDVGDGKWAPTPAELRRVAVARIKPLSQQVSDIREILDAKPMLPAERPQNSEDRAAAAARVRATLNATVDALNPFPPAPKAPDVRNSEMERAAAEAQLDAVADRLRSPVRVSGELAKRLEPAE